MMSEHNKNQSDLMIDAIRLVVREEITAAISNGKPARQNGSLFAEVLNGFVGCLVSGVSTPMRRTRSPFSITSVSPSITRSTTRELPSIGATRPAILQPSRLRTAPNCNAFHFFLIASIVTVRIGQAPCGRTFA